MSTLHFREAKSDEFDLVNAFYDTMIDVMVDTDFDVKWKRDVHPSPAMLKDALAAGELYIGVVDDEPAHDEAATGASTDPVLADRASGDQAHIGQAHADQASRGQTSADRASCDQAPADRTSADRVHEGRIASALVMDTNAAEGYEGIPWHIRALPGEYGVVHLLGVLPEYHGQGIATRMMEGALQAARAKGMKAVRLDVLPHNRRGVGLYEKVGFANLGSHSLHYPELGPREFIMFEYVL